jgi:eukaryotic-like serine/threonine-protein kinase
MAMGEPAAESSRRIPICVGDVIAGKYRVDRLLGAGGMGLVVAATHLELGTSRAIKLMLPETTTEPMADERFLREARAASELKSQHIAHVFDVGRLADGSLYMVMEYLEGHDLSTVLEAGGPMPIEDVALYVLEACEALAEAHGRGIVHRDLKPSNLFLARANDGSLQVKVLDFGISKLVNGDGTGAKTRTGALLGSPLYMSPEQVQSASVADARSDVWAIGVMLYELCTGQCPFDSEHVMGILGRIAYANPAKPSTLRADVPAALDAVILRCLEKQPERRYQDVAALARALAPLAPASAAALVERIERVHVVAASPTSSHGSLPRISVTPPSARPGVDPSSEPMRGPASGNAPTLAADTSGNAGEPKPLPPAPRKPSRGLLVVASLVVAIAAGALAWIVTAQPEGEAPARVNTAPAPAATSAELQVTPLEPPLTAQAPNHDKPVGTVLDPPRVEASTPATAATGTTTKPIKKATTSSTSGPPPRY